MRKRQDLLPHDPSFSRAIIAFLLLLTFQVYKSVGSDPVVSLANNNNETGFLLQQLPLLGQQQQQQDDPLAIHTLSTSAAVVAPSAGARSGGTAGLSIPNYRCMEHCKCEYKRVAKQLEVECSRRERSPARDVAITDGIRHLILREVTLKEQVLSNILPEVADNVLVELHVHDALIDPVQFFKAPLFHRVQESLSVLEIRNGVYSSQRPLTAIPLFSRLQALDRLMICDSSPELSSLILQSLPPALGHITITNSTIRTLDPLKFAHLRSLKSLNLSANHIRTIPTGLTDNLQGLRVLDLSRNEIEHLQERVFHGLSSLEKLDVSRNRIRYLDTEIFNPLSEIKEIDLSHNNVIQFFEPYFQQNAHLSTLNMRQTWTANTFRDPKTGPRSRMEMEKLINTLQSIQSLDLSDNDMMIIPETLTHTTVRNVRLEGNHWKCSCDDRWFLYWLETASVSPPTDIQCHDDPTPLPIKQRLSELNCKSPNIYSKVPRKYYTHMGLNPLLSCHIQGSKTPWPVISWRTPQNKKLAYSATTTTTLHSSNNYEEDRLRVMPNGTLLVSNFTKSDFGLYICVAQYQDLNITHYVHVGVDTSIFSDVRIMSFILGWTTSFAFVFLVVTVHIIKCLLRRCGVECYSTVGKSYQARRLRKFFESMEQHKTSQLDWLRDNYNMQARKIKDNCISQVERIRESYAVQHKNLSDIRDYGTNQLHQLRDQYYDQIRRVSGYSAQQLCKVRENYLFQRNRVCKFSSHQLLRLRETYKWQAQTLNKILENLPTLNLDTCRGIGTCGRTDSIYLEDITEFQPADEASYIPGNVYSLQGMPAEKMEHVSLLIPPEFLLPPVLLAEDLTTELGTDPGPSESKQDTKEPQTPVEQVNENTSSSSPSPRNCGRLLE